MHFRKVISADSVIEHVVRVISNALESEKRVLWLVSGGSAIDIAVEVAKRLIDTDSLLVMQVDERYGEVGHSGSNWQKLREAGFEDMGFKCRPVLSGKDLDSTVQDYTEALEAAFSEYDYKIGLFGIGADGHTAGILPGSPASESKELVSTFQGPDYQRITITPVAIARLDSAIASAFGDVKAETLRNLQKDIPVNVQSAQLLKTVKDAWIYNDQIGEKE